VFGKQKDKKPQNFSPKFDPTVKLLRTKQAIQRHKNEYVYSKSKDKKQQKYLDEFPCP
jgi:hypothetical protein